jgi:hypothetical protein
LTKKLAFFSKTNVIINFFKFSFVSSKKANFLGENILQNHNLGPWKKEVKCWLRGASLREHERIHKTSLHTLK